MCDRYKGDSSAKRLLDTTHKPNLGAERSGNGADEAQTARRSSVESVNKRAAKQTGAPVRRSRRAAAAGKQEK